MSFILDALKKSENQRQRQVGPSLADIPLRRARADRPWWAVAVAALLVVNLGVLVVVLTRDRTPTAPAPVVAQQPAPAQQAPIVQPQAQLARPQVAPSMSAPAPTRTNPAVHSLAEEAGAETEMLPNDESIDPDLSVAASVPEGPPLVRPITPPTVAPVPNHTTFGARARSAAAEEELLPTHSSLVANGTNLPEMRLDIHVYSAKPNERFVFVNMRKYVEGQAMSEGPTVERITTDGAILNQRGTRFLLPRQ
jgi:general secretion pathway protein B